MLKDLRIVIMVVLIFSLPVSALCQSDRFAFAVTDVKKEGGSWIVLRKLDTRTGTFSNALVDGSNPEIVLYESGTGGKFVSTVKDTSQLFQPQLPFGSGVAAIAYDRKNNRLFYTPMYIDQLRYLDISTMKVFCVTGQGFTSNAGSKNHPANTLSRMVIAGDGYGYSISNDGNHLYRFSTGGLPEIADMGALKDYPGNNDMTIHNACSNGGGDIIADDDGNLYLLTAFNRVYKINISNLETKYLGIISGLPEKFSVNGAAVDDEGKILVSSSLYNDAYYKVDPVTWKASEYKPKNGLYKSADLANSNVLVTKKTSANNASVILSGKTNFIKLYPNPAENNLFKIQFTNLDPGEYQLQLTDIHGRTLLRKKIDIHTATHTESVRIPPKSSIGLYMVKIVNEKNNQVFSEKLMVKEMQ